MELNIKEMEHPNKWAEQQYNQLIGIEEEKKKLEASLIHILDGSRMKNWLDTHHSGKLSIFDHVITGTPLIILEGDVGCGKTALAQSIPTIIGARLEKKIKVFETPSNIRGGGMVGGISDRITTTFEQAKRQLKNDEPGILIIDEADDLATGREQNQAHHEDRAGVNVLIKEIDAIKKDQKKMAVIMITNRVGVMDPAIRRRCLLRLTFRRPTGENLQQLVDYIFEHVEASKKEINQLVKELSEREHLYSFSDLTQRVAKEAIYKCIEKNIPFTISAFKEVLKELEPSPSIK